MKKNQILYSVPLTYIFKRAEMIFSFKNVFQQQFELEKLVHDHEARGLNTYWAKSIKKKVEQ